MTVQLEAAELAKEVRVPTLVLHCKGDRVAPLEEGRDMARFIPGARFIELPGNNHALLALAGTQASTNSSRRRPTSSRCMTASFTALSPRGLLRVTSDGRGSRRRLLLLDPEAVVQGRTSILQEARLASPYPKVWRPASCPRSSLVGPQPCRSGYAVVHVAGDVGAAPGSKVSVTSMLPPRHHAFRGARSPDVGTS
jgi:hypothetical protein